LAENNIAEHELQAINTWLVSLKRFVRWQILLENRERDDIDVDDIPAPLKESHPNWLPILIGIPTKYNYGLYAHLLRHQQVGNLLLPHQVHLATWHIEQWTMSYDELLQKNLCSLQRFIPSNQTTINWPTNRRILNRVSISTEWDISIDDSAETIRSRMLNLLKLAPRAEELAYLMDEFTTQFEVNSVTDEHIDSTDAYFPSDRTAFIDKGLVIRFRENYEAIFDPKDRIQVVVRLSRGRDLQVRSVRSLRPGDTVLFINGHHRQNLYDLILSRVHDHPTFALHISLIERWQDELVTCFKKAQKPLSTILAQMQAKGSQLQTETAIRFWLWRQVMCPNDPKDLKRIADILGMPFVKQYYPQIDRAARRLRGIHISLAHKLNTWLEKESLSSAPQTFNEIVDSEPGLDFKDFQEALMILTVESVVEENGLFLTTELGQLRIIN